MKRPRAAILPILLGLVPCTLACREDEPSPPGVTPPPPATTGMATGTGSGSDETAQAPVACGCASGDTAGCGCPSGQACAADYALGDPDPAPEAFTCRTECIPAGDPLLWCFYDEDAADPGLGCCSGTCRPDGLCGEPPGASTGGTSTDGTSTDGTSSTGTSTDGTGTTAGTGTSTGGTGTSGTGTGTSTG